MTGSDDLTRHVCAFGRHLKAAGSPGLVVDPGKIVW